MRSRTERAIAQLGDDIARANAELNAQLQLLEPAMQPKPETSAPTDTSAQASTPVARSTPPSTSQSSPELTPNAPQTTAAAPSTFSGIPDLDSIKAQILDSSRANVNGQKIDEHLRQVQKTLVQLTQVEKQASLVGQSMADLSSETTPLIKTLVSEFKALAMLEGISPEIQNELGVLAQVIADLPQNIALNGDGNNPRDLAPLQANPQNTAAQALQNRPLQFQKEPPQAPKEVSKDTATQTVSGSNRNPASATTTAQATAKTENTEESQKTTKTPREQYLEKKQKLEEKHSKELKELEASEEEEIKELEKEEEKELDSLENKDDALAKKEIKEKFSQRRKEIVAKYSQKRKELEKEQANEYQDLDREHPESALEEKQKAQQRQDPRFHKGKDKHERRKGRQFANEIGYSEGEKIAGTEKKFTLRRDAPENEELEEKSPSLIKQITSFFAGIFGKP